MFKIAELILKDKTDKEYSYKFSSGINFFKGKNSSGKTVFYELIDYMLGSSDTLNNKEWYTDLKEVSMIINMENKKFILTRTKNVDINYVSILDTRFQNRHPIDLKSYNIKLGHIFARNENILEDIKTFTGESLTFRTFTMFNFLGENGQGLIRYFLDKCNDVKYSVKLSPVLNFIFNNHQKEISKLQIKIDELTQDCKILQENYNKYEFVKSEINRNAEILRLNVDYNGKNKDEIKARIEKIKNLDEVPSSQKDKSLSELKVMHNNIKEQIVLYERAKKDAENIQKENENRKKLLDTLNSIIEENNTLMYLTAPIKSVLDELDSTFSFSQYMIKDETINKLKKQRDILRDEIKKYSKDYEFYPLREKEKALILMDNYLAIEESDCSEELKKKQEEIKRYRAKIKELQGADDFSKISKLSKYITNLYYTAKEVSSFVKTDSERDGFRIEYIKQGNVLQPKVSSKSKDNKTLDKIYIGSKARHTLIQLCGYMGLLKLLLQEAKYPLVPIFLGDHLSQSFDNDNVKAIGAILNKASNDIGINDFQIFLFDDKTFNEMNVHPSHYEDLYKEDEEGNIIQSGFVPFYFPPVKKN